MIYPCNADGGSSRISLLQSAVVHVSLGVAEKLTALAQLGQQFNFDILKLCSYVISRLYKSVSFDYGRTLLKIMVDYDFITLLAKFPVFMYENFHQFALTNRS